MALHPQARAAIERAAGETPVHSPDFDVVAAREQARELAASEPREPVASVSDHDADGVPVRLYEPADARPGLVVHAHGGGFVLNDVEVHDAACRALANRARRRVLSIDYRRPPEHRFPAAPDDVSTVVGWLEGPAAPASVRGARLAMHGDSAGANLALVAALRHPGRFAALVLVYPFLDPTASFDSYRTAADGFDPRDAAWYWEQYAATAADLTHPDLAPLGVADQALAGLPPLLVATAEHDPLRDEGEHLATRAVEAGVTVVATRWLGQIHGFWRHLALFPAADALMRQTGGFLDAHLDAHLGA